MPECSIRPIYVNTTAETVYHVYILHEQVHPNLDDMHKWIEKNFDDYDTLNYGKQYLFHDIKGFDFAFKLTWS